MNWLLLPLAAALAAAPVARPFVAQGDHWQIRLNLPAGWKSCTAPVPAPNHGFVLTTQKLGCDDAAAAPLRFVVENNLEDELPAIEALQQQSGCRPASKGVERHGQGWSLCRDASGGETALHLQSCGDNPNDAVIFTLQRRGVDPDAQALFGQVLEQVKLRCPKAPP